MRSVAPLALVSLLTAVAACDKTENARQETILVAAASSLREILTDSKAAFEADHPGTNVTFSFEASSTLARKIDEGAPFDVFLSADAETVEKVRNLIDATTIAPFLSNRLALVRRAGLIDAAATPPDLIRRDGKIAVAGPAVPAGKYARAYLEKAGLREVLEPRIVEADSVRAALALVESGAADYAFVYKTDAAIARSATLVWADDHAEGPQIRYVAAVLNRTVAPGAREYVRWLKGAQFLSAAEASGFKRP